MFEKKLIQIRAEQTVTVKSKNSKLGAVDKQTLKNKKKSKKRTRKRKGKVETAENRFGGGEKQIQSTSEGDKRNELQYVTANRKPPRRCVLYSIYI